MLDSFKLMHLLFPFIIHKLDYAISETHNVITSSHLQKRVGFTLNPYFNPFLQICESSNLRSFFNTCFLKKDGQSKISTWLFNYAKKGRIEDF